MTARKKMATSQSQPPKVKPTLAPLPDLVVKQLRASMENWNARYGTPIQAVCFKVVGKISTNDERREVIQWICANSVFPVGKIFDPKTLRVVSMDEAGVTRDEREKYEAMVSDLVVIGDYVIAMKWQDQSKRASFITLTIADQHGIKYDSLLTGVVTAAQGKLDPSSANTDCEWWRFGWIWQTEFDDMTRGEVKACLTVVCDNAGNAVDCLKSKHCFMQLGSCDVDITNVRRVGNCCRAETAWGVATGTVTAKVTIEGDHLKVEFEGTFGSESKGGRDLRDCCPPSPARISMTEHAPLHEEVTVAALRSGAPIHVAREIGEAVSSRAREVRTLDTSRVRDMLIEELRSRNPRWATRLLENEQDVGRSSIQGCC